MRCFLFVNDCSFLSFFVRCMQPMIVLVDGVTSCDLLGEPMSVIHL